MRRRSSPAARTAIGAVIASLVVVAVVAAPSPALAGPEKEIVINEEPTEGDEFARAQEPLVAAATAITALDPKREALGGIRLQVKEGAIEVYWKGEVPDAVHKEIAAQEGNGVRVALRPADYSGYELNAALTEIIEQRDRYPGLMVLVPLPEASGLQGYFTDPSAAKEYAFPVPVGIELAPEGTVPATRNNDFAPFWGGAAAVVGGRGTCTTGFAVAQRFFGVELSRGVLSAAHCDPSGGSTWTTPTGRVIGRAGGPVGLSDSIYIRTSSSGRVYTGPVGSNTSKQIVGPVPNFPGQFVCTEGAATGEHCLVMNVFVGGASFIGGSLNLGVTFAQNITGAFAVGQGDSGGPVIVSGNPFAGLAAGLISFLVAGVPCTPGSPVLCSSMVGYIDINWVLASNFPMVLVP